VIDFVAQLATRISQNILIKWFWKVNSPHKIFNLLSAITNQSQLPPQNCQFIFGYYQFKKQVDDFVGELTFQNHLMQVPLVVDFVARLATLAVSIAVRSQVRTAGVGSALEIWAQHSSGTIRTRFPRSGNSLARPRPETRNHAP